MEDPRYKYMIISIPQTLIILAFVSVLSRVALAQEPVAPLDPNDKNTDKDIIIESGITNERVFIQSFVARRKQHLEAVKNVRQITSYEKRYAMVSLIADNALNIIASSRTLLESTKLTPGDAAPLKNSTIRAALSGILENGALLGDVILQLPDIAHRMMKKHKTWYTTMQWSLTFVNETQHLLDEPTLTMLDLVRQELKLVPRDPTYTNPYWSHNNKETKSVQDRRVQKKVSKKSVRTKGPRLFTTEL